VVEAPIVFRIAAGTTVEESSERVRLVRGRIAVAIEPVTAPVRHLVRRLDSSGATAADIRDVGETAELLYVVAMLEERGLLAAEVPSLLRVEPLRGAVQVTRAATPPEPALSRFAFVRPEDGALELESPLAAGRAILSGHRGGALAGALAAGETAGLDADERAAVALLAAAGLLAGELEEREPARAWEWHDLLLHMETRGWSDGRPRGGTYRLRGIVDPPPDARRHHDGAVVELERADLEELVRSDVPFAAVVERRRSERRFDDARPVTAAELGRLLHRAAARRILFTHQGVELSRRPAPSAGALAALELYAVVRRCDGLDPGLYHYEADTHRLRHIGAVPPELAGALADAGDPPQVTLAVFLRHARIAWKYERIAYQLALLDLGVLYQMLWLTATAMGLGGFPLGSVAAERFAAAAGSDPLEETGLGAFLLGRPAESRGLFYELESE
jgi:oxazoline/thiazoline dehydrogenase